jgi:ferrous iron transport protein B
MFKGSVPMIVKSLAECAIAEPAIILKVRGRGGFRKRILEMGFVAGQKVIPVKEAPLGDPVEYTIMGYNVSLRKHEARMIDIAPCDADSKTCSYEGVIESAERKTGSRPIDRVINVALVGNPNCGKTTIFNSASGSREHVGNYGGVTIEAKESSFDYRGFDINITDLPGTYSITAYTPEELYVRSFIFENTPDIVINVIDASNLERNLYLTTQLIDMDIKVIIAFNMYDEFLKKGDRFDYTMLGSMIGIPIVPTIGSKGTGIIKLFDKVIEVYEDRDSTVRHIHINYGEEIERSIAAIQNPIRIEDNATLTDMISSRFLAVKLIEKDTDARERVASCVNAGDILATADTEITRIEKVYADDSETVITDAKYGFISGALKETVISGTESKRSSSKIIDTILTHRWLGFPVFIAFMWFIFQATFTFGKYPMSAIESAVEGLSFIVGNYMTDGSLKALIIDGILGGVGGVIIFLPNILILFFFISLMEDTGYMARAAFIMDRLMHKIGLHGKSFIPLIMGFGCNVPAVMATRTIESRNDRIVTILITPFMSCSARLPVYVLFISAFFPNRPGTVLFSLYIIGIIIAALSALLFKKTLFRSHDIPFVMELPPYRVPTVRSTSKHMWDKGVQYLKKMGGVILVSSIIIWALGYFPRTASYANNYDVMIESIRKDAEIKRLNLDPVLDKTEIAGINADMTRRISGLEREKESERQHNSYIARMGKVIEPVIKPLGFDWRIGVSIVTGLAAKEIVVSSMGVIFNADVDSEDSTRSLSAKLKSQTIIDGAQKGKPLFTPLVAFSFMIFVLLYFPCIATVAAMKKETGSILWPTFSLLYSTGMAWLVSFTVYQIGSRI